jgi:hypothetical protein
MLSANVNLSDHNLTGTPQKAKDVRILSLVLDIYRYVIYRPPNAILGYIYISNILICKLIFLFLCFVYINFIIIDVRP